MAKSIVQSKKECYITGSTYNLHKHHIFEGTANRKLSEKYGLWIYLRADWHNLSTYGVHFNRELDIKLKKSSTKEMARILQKNKRRFYKNIWKELFIGGK